MSNFYISNAFSINMLSDTINLKMLKLESCCIPPNYIWAIGHQDTSILISKTMLNKKIDANRITIKPDFENGDILVVAQYKGERLPEGATELPEGATIEYWYVTKAD